jgi:hypothetical protein
MFVLPIPPFIRHLIRSRSSLAAAFALMLFAGCVAETLSARQFGELLNRYPPAVEPLRIGELTSATLEALPADARGKTVTIIVHPAYSLFFRQEHRNRYTDAKYDLLQIQLEREEQFIREISATGNILILVLPGSYAQESVAPLSYTAYLNRAAGGSTTVFSVYSETANSGAVPTDTLVRLYSFLRGLGTDRVLVGGGYIGRCQREFYSQLVTYVDSISFYIVPEISSISPDDISDRESREVLDGIRTGDFSLVAEFIRKRTKASARTLALPEL